MTLDIVTITRNNNICVDERVAIGKIFENINNKTICGSAASSRPVIRDCDNNSLSRVVVKSIVAAKDSGRSNKDLSSGVECIAEKSEIVPGFRCKCDNDESLSPLVTTTRDVLCCNSLSDNDDDNNNNNNNNNNDNATNSKNAEATGDTIRRDVIKVIIVNDKCYRVSQCFVKCLKVVGSMNGSSHGGVEIKEIIDAPSSEIGSNDRKNMTMMRINVEGVTSSSKNESPPMIESQQRRDSKVAKITRSSAPGKTPRCKLNANNCVSLKDILVSFNGPVSEEQAWALCYQCAKCYKNSLQLPIEAPASSNTKNRILYDVSDVSHVMLHKDGDVHSTTIREPAHADERESLTSEHQLVFSLGVIVFTALDFSLDEEEERPLAPDLDALITLMTQREEESEVETRHQETDDEGIERDSGDSENDPVSHEHEVHSGYVRGTTQSGSPAPCSLNTVLQLCSRHLQGTAEQADTHYKAVIRALVTEALELSHFLDKVAADKEGNSSLCRSTGDRNLDALDFSDWARFWVQVIGELRRGVKLKKVDRSAGYSPGTGNSPNSAGKRGRSGRGIEFELTPYEILMDDIRARRYRLRKTPSPSPHLRKDAHAVILDFIRSRPPLKKASERKLPPLMKQPTPRELLMESIKRPPRPLRPSSTPVNFAYNSCWQSSKPLTSGGSREDSPESSVLVPTPKSSRHGSKDVPRSQPRRLIPVDFDLKLDGEEDDEDDIVTRFDDEATDYWKDDADDDEDEVELRGRAAYDLATQCPTRRVATRRHTVVGATGYGARNVAGTLSLPHSRPQSRQHELVQQNDTPTKTTERQQLDTELASKRNNSQDELASEKSPSTRNASLGDMFLDERLSLTLEEIVHIRSVLTKAELESLPVEGRVKEDVEKRRVCFLCLKTRFGILGPWGQRCRLCERTVCVKCYSKMRIPTEHFAHIPVVLLSPGLLLSPSSSEADGKEYGTLPGQGGMRSLWPRPAGGVGSAPASPASKRRDHSGLRNTTPTPTSLSASQSQTEEKGRTYENNSLPPSESPATSTQTPDKRGKFGCSSANCSPARSSASVPRYGVPDVRVAERLRGVAMVVCHDCRILVLQIIKSSRTTRATIRNNVISRLTLNLSPIYV